MMRYFSPLCLMLLLVLLPLTSQAQKDDTGSSDEQKISKTPVKALQDATDDLLEGLSDKQLRQYRAIRSSHGLIRSIENVRGTLDRAVKTCADNNPDIADDLEQRFVKWKRTIRPHLNEAREKRDDMIVLQSFTEPQKVRDHLETFDKAAAYKNDMFEKTPVSDAESCRNMMEKMQSTQKRLITLLKERLSLYDQLQGKGDNGQ